MCNTYWLSFCDPERPKGQQACLVDAEDFVAAAKEAHKQGCNPGGEVMGSEVIPEVVHLIEPHWKNRLLTEEEVEEIDHSMRERLRQAGLPDPGPADKV